MPITKDSGRQDVSAAYVDFTYADLASGTFAGAIDLPVGAVVVGGFVLVTTAWDSGTSDVLDVGISTDDDKYAAALDLQTTGVAALTGLGALETSAVTLGLTVTSDAGEGVLATHGAARLVVKYIVDGRAEFSQG